MQQRTEEPFSREFARRAVREIQSLPFQPELADTLVALLEQHGAHVQRVQPSWIIRFPEGTMRYEIYPRTLEIRARLIFPDGTTILETIDRHRLSCLSFPLEDLPEAIWQDHAGSIRTSTCC